MERRTLPPRPSVKTGRRESDDIEDQVRFIKGHVGKMSWGARIAALGVISSLLGTMYGGFLIWQKVEALAALDLDAVQGDIAQIQIDLQKNNDYTRDIKNGLRDDILRIEKVTDRVEDDVNGLEDKIRTLIDDAEIRFETKREQLRMSQSASLKELEQRINQRIQLALDNPLAN
jgi:cell division protein FtsX